MAVTTALDIIQRALRKARVLGTGDILSDEDAQLSLDTLNLMLDSWSIDRLFVYVEQIQTLTTTGAQSYTVGSGGALNISRPNKLTSAYAQVSGVSYVMEILDSAAQYDAIRLKALGGVWPSVAFYEKTYPLGTLYLWPLGSGYDVKLRFMMPLQEFTTLTTQIQLPAGYKEAIVNALAVKLAEDFNTEIAQTVVQSAANAIARLKRLNRQPVTRSLEVSMASTKFNGYSAGEGAAGDVFTDQFGNSFLQQ